MIRVSTRVIVFVCMLSATLTGVVRGAEVFFLLKNEFDLTEGDDAQIKIFEDRGDTVDLWDHSRFNMDPDEPLAAADLADLVWVDESVGSRFTDLVRDTTTPVINNENFACDIFGTVPENDPDFSQGHGSPGTVNSEGFELAAGTHFGTSIEIVDQTHPIAIAAGLENGPLVVYDDQDLGDEGGGRIDWCNPEGDADIIALIPGFTDSYPTSSTVYVYEEGAAMADGRVAPGMRIGLFVSDTNAGPPPADDPGGATAGAGPGWEATLLTEAGLGLINAAIDYALGLISENPIGDFDGNGVLDAVDIDMLTVASAGELNPVEFDLNGDSLVNAGDVVVWAHDLKNIWIGDADANGEFNSSDIIQILAAGKFQKDEDAVWTQGDFNGDGRFVSGDLVVALADGGFGAGARTATAAVPEPSALVLLAMGGLFLLRRR